MVAAAVDVVGADGLRGGGALTVGVCPDAFLLRPGAATSGTVGVLVGGLAWARGGSEVCHGFGVTNGASSDRRDADTRRTVAPTATPDTSTPPNTRPAIQPRESGTLWPARLADPSTGCPVVGTRGAIMPAAEKSVRFGTSGGTVSLGAVVSGAPWRSWYAWRTPSCIRWASGHRFSRSNASARSTTCATVGAMFGAPEPRGGAALRHGAEEHLVARAAVVYELAAKQVEHGRADGPQVASRVDIVPEPSRLLRRHVRGRSHAGARLGRGARAGQFAQSRDPKVEHLDLPRACEEHVLGLDVAMHDSVRMCSREHVQELVGD